MSMTIGTDYSAYRAGHTSVDIPDAEKGDFEEHRKWSESIKPELDEWKANNAAAGRATIRELSMKSLMNRLIIPHIPSTR